MVDRLVGRSAMTVFHDRHAGVAEVDKFVATSLKDGKREGRRSGIEVHRA
jgi:hypothetical protein